VDAKTSNSPGIPSEHIQVLVIGAGPAGLFAAAELARHGVQARVVERAAGPHHQARATAIQPGTLEILAQVGLVDRFIADSVQLPFARLFDLDLEPLGEMAFAESGCEWSYQCSLPQWRTERILAERLAELGGAVEHGVEVLSLESRQDTALVALRRADGTPETITADWVLGAGGAHSVTRDAIHEQLAGETYLGHSLVADVRVHCGLPRDGGALIATPDGYVLLAPLPDERWICFVGDFDGPEAPLLEGEEATRAVATAFERRVGGKIQLDDIAWAAGFRMHRRLARRLVVGRSFLLGDAGHLSSPFGGEGLNSGLHDGHNLAWKLALELRGRARPGLLDSYGAERLIADRHVLEVSDELHELATGVVESARAGARPEFPPPEDQAAIVRARSMLDFSYAGTALVGEHLGDPGAVDGSPGPGDRYPDRASLAGTTHHLLLSGDADERALDRLRRRWNGLVEIGRAPGRDSRGGSTALLVRPDGYVGFRATPADEEGLDALDAHLDSYLVPD
jgi:6-methylpretetramide 4-monooxygenase / 4-hydroxy-6-methylpretetramide 12a-monooxygenase